MLQKAVVVNSLRTWERLRDRHRALEASPPYAQKTFLFRLTIVRVLSPPLCFQHPRGAVNIVLYRPP